MGHFIIEDMNVIKISNYRKLQQKQIKKKLSKK